ncbi:methyltransferase TYW3-domain-containing protein [Chaetomidium leptoderma]|uniref:tRNA(Phe) 7-[(3-amino-3-carboxypropyl)-4-demethylwyosine(37)-N(4)]-methyltransferase n=1 Tax=Chaetomidium leptoderma TaxID=669021 RepID=A0AAN6VP21_9PEZI|nr:methyltransferase TYW3-domain-containing protein [Chaetomidium leptoderma]
MKQLPAPGNNNNNTKTTTFFALKKQTILSQLSRPDESYTDASPKGSVDVGVRHLIGHINAHAGLVTTSSCAGRVSVYLEGRKSTTTTAAAAVAGGGGGGGGEGGEGEEGGRAQAVPGITTPAAAASAVGGKGGGEWLFVSHDPVTDEEEHGGEEGYERLLLGGGPELVAASVAGEETAAARRVEVDGSSRLIHFKFEPMILHVLTASLEHAQLVIQAGMEAGFRETGAVSLLKRQADDEATPMVAVRSMGLSFESLIGAETDGHRRLIVSPQYLKTLVQLANERFVENEKRIARFSAALEAAFAPPKGKENWEDAQARRERKRQEGLRRRDEVKKDKSIVAGEFTIDFILQEPDVL